MAQVLPLGAASSASMYCVTKLDDMAKEKEKTMPGTAACTNTPTFHPKVPTYKIQAHIKMQAHTYNIIHKSLKCGLCGFPSSPPQGQPSALNPLSPVDSTVDGHVFCRLSLSFVLGSFLALGFQVGL